MASVRVELLGPLRVWRDRVAVRVTGRRQRLLLSILAADHRRTVPSARLIDALWSDDEPLDPLNTLQQYVAHLRRALQGSGSDPGLIVTSPPGYRLDLPVGGLDLEEQESLVRRARAALEAGEPHSAVSFGERALGLWRGTAFEEFADHPFLLGPARRVSDTRLAAVEALADGLRSTTGPGPVVELLGPHPEWWGQRESLTVSLVWALAGVERVADALACAERYRLAATERGVGVGPVLSRLTEEVAVFGRARTPIGVGGPASPAESVLRQVVVTLPTLTADHDDGVPLDHLVAVARALNLASIAFDTPRWLAELARHAPGFDRALAAAVASDPGRGIDLALELARYADWVGLLPQLRTRLAALVEALPPDVPARRADAHGWLGFAWRHDDPSLALAHLDLALNDAVEPDELGRTWAVASVVWRATDPARAMEAAEESVQLLRRHGNAEEAAYAHVVASMAALELGRGDVAAGHVSDAAALYSGTQHPSGLAWIDVIESRLAGHEPRRAIEFAGAHGDTSVVAMLDRPPPRPDR